MYGLEGAVEFFFFLYIFIYFFGGGGGGAIIASYINHTIKSRGCNTSLCSWLLRIGNIAHG